MKTDTITPTPPKVWPYVLHHPV